MQRDISGSGTGMQHDYHNHLQVMKARIAAGQLEEMKQYLDDLEENRDRVNTYVKSGNLMADAILNSKLSLADKYEGYLTLANEPGIFAAEVTLPL